jgi:hypothetical protein
MDNATVVSRTNRAPERDELNFDMPTILVSEIKIERDTLRRDYGWLLTAVLAMQFARQGATRTGYGRYVVDCKSVKIG